MAMGRHGLQENRTSMNILGGALHCHGSGVKKGKRAREYLPYGYASCCEMAGINIPGTVEGKLTVGSRREPKPLRDTLYGVYCGGSKPNRSIRIGDWRLVSSTS